MLLFLLLPLCAGASGNLIAPGKLDVVAKVLHESCM